MHFIRTQSDGIASLVAVDDTEAFDLTAASDRITSLCALASVAGGFGESIEEAARRFRDAAPAVDADAITDASCPITPDEVWATGGTFALAPGADEELSDLYADIYDADRPQFFFKATAGNTVGPGDHIGIRRDSTESIPEAELAAVLYDGTVVGYTIANDVSSRSLEMMNPLYLSEAKVYDRSCAIGPSVVAPSAMDPQNVEVRLSIQRTDETVFSGSMTTDALAYTPEEIVEAYATHNAVPELAVVLLGTRSVSPEAGGPPPVPPNGFALQADDVVRISIDPIGVLENPVTVV